MPKTSKFFYDSYAVLAYLSDNQNYRRYFEENDGFLTKLNLMEICYRTLEMYGEEAASQIVQIFTKYLMEYGTADIEGAMKLRLQLTNKSRDVS